jgi:hypothetical protein
MLREKKAKAQLELAGAGPGSLETREKIIAEALGGDLSKGARVVFGRLEDQIKIERAGPGKTKPPVSTQDSFNQDLSPELVAAARARADKIAKEKARRKAEEDQGILTGLAIRAAKPIVWAADKVGKVFGNNEKAENVSGLGLEELAARWQAIQGGDAGITTAGPEVSANLGQARRDQALAVATEAAAAAPPSQAVVTLKPDTTVADGTFTPSPMGRGGYSVRFPGFGFTVSAEDNSDVIKPIVADGIMNGTA